MQIGSKLIMAGLTMGGLLLAAGCARKTEATVAPDEDQATVAIEYPDTRRVDQVDTYHGVEVADPYRWLEADVRESAEVAAWVDEQSAVARAYLDAIPQRPAIHRRLTELWNYERYSAPSIKNGKYFYFRNDGLQNQSVLFVAEAFDAVRRVLVGPPGSVTIERPQEADVDERLLIDPNTWSEDGTVSLRSTSVSDDARYLAYSRSDAGSDWQTIYVMEVDSGEHLPDRLEWVRFGGVSWNKDGTGFYYSRYPEPPEGEEYQSVALNQMIYFHRLGTEQADDVLIYRQPENPDWSFRVRETDDGEYLVLSIHRSTDPQNRVYVRAADAPADSDWNALIDDFDNQFSFVGNDGEQFFFLTDLAAPTKRIVAMDIASPGREHLAEIVPANEGTLRSASFLGGRIIAQYVEDVRSRVRLFDVTGDSLGEVELPGIGSVSGFDGREHDTETFYTWTSYTHPPMVYRYDVSTGESRLWFSPLGTRHVGELIVEQVFCTSKDGTRVPMTLAYRSDLPRDEPLPTLLYAYGGFNIPILPHYSVEYLAWIEMGGVLAVANLRGGGEYGEEWHLAGKALNKQNVFDDFIAAAEWLIDEGRTSPDKLAIMGGSNGGLLVGAVMTQRPELFGACIPNVGVLDMLRFQEFTAGQFWRDEYGHIDNEDEFHALLAYSPYHNVSQGVEYPPTLVMTADTDDRVVPMHSFKFAAALQHAQAGEAPILLRIETRAGHGRGTPVTKRIDIAADRWAFLAKTLQMDVPTEK